jgi:hypothetical protein
METVDRLRQATTDLLWVSESEYPLEVINWGQNVEISIASIIDRQHIDPDCLIEQLSLVDLLSPAMAIEDWYESAELAIVEKFQQLQQAIESSLSDVTVFRVGEIEVEIYILGKSNTGDTIAIVTKSVET